MRNYDIAACYAAIYACSNEGIDTIDAYSRMVAALFQNKQYNGVDIDRISKDFNLMYGFTIPDLPMKTILSQCVNMGFLTVLNKRHSKTLYLPNREAIDTESFNDIYKQKESEYNKIYFDYQEFLKSKNRNIDKESFFEEINAFLSEHGFDYMNGKFQSLSFSEQFSFVQYLVNCIENGKNWVMDYINDFIVGWSLSQSLALSLDADKIRFKNTTVYLDVGILFKLFGIDSANSNNYYEEFISEMKKMGIIVKTYIHTVREMEEIIGASKTWIGNPAYDATKCSEATYYFVTNDYSIFDIDQLLSDLRGKITDFGIVIEDFDYPHYKDIHTDHEEDIKDVIISLYKESHSDFDIEQKRYTIEQDAKSIFFTHYKNGGDSAQKANDIKNLFITSNSTLAKVGDKLHYSCAKKYPVIMTDVKWGTIIWFNCPTKISSVNRAKLVSYAYAAFRPSKAVTEKFNAYLFKLQEKGQVTPEQCYLLKASPVAQKLLLESTGNVADRLNEETPLAILKTLKSDAFEEGARSRQTEVDELVQKTEALSCQLNDLQFSKEKDRIIDKLSDLNVQREMLLSEKERTECELKELNDVRSKGEKNSKKITTAIRISLAFFLTIIIAFCALSYFCGSGKIGSLVFGGSSFVIFIIYLVVGNKLNFFNLLDKVKNKYISYYYKKYRCTDEKYNALIKKFDETQADIDNAENAMSELNNILEKLDKSSDEAYTKNIDTITV